MKHQFKFTAHRLGTERETTITVQVDEREAVAFADLADHAADRAIMRAARRLGCDEDEIEIRSED